VHPRTISPLTNLGEPYLQLRISKSGAREPSRRGSRKGAAAGLPPGPLYERQHTWFQCHHHIVAAARRATLAYRDGLLLLAQERW